MQLYTWGASHQGQLGHGPLGRFGTPVPRAVRVGGSGGDLAGDHDNHRERTRLALVSCGQYHTAALTTTGQLWTWGMGHAGRLGLGDTRHRDVPTHVQCWEKFRRSWQQAQASLRPANRAARLDGGGGCSCTAAAAPLGSAVVELSCGGAHTLTVVHAEPAAAAASASASATGSGRRHRSRTGCSTSTGGTEAATRTVCAFGGGSSGQLGLGCNGDALLPHIWHL
eukprot:COSAG01_NODE_206_length_22034_cov_125.512585_2_plen_225_part_00